MASVEQESRDLVLPLLRQCAAAAPLPCDVREWARARDLAPEHFECLLEVLADAGVLQRTAEGDKVALTDTGAKLLQKPQPLAKFCAAVEEELPPPGGNLGQWKTVRDILRTTPRPIINRLLIWANLLVFGLGVLLAARHNLAFEFVMPIQPGMAGLRIVRNANLDDIYRTTGQLRRSDVLEGHWWRLLACCFVHFGVIHLAMNMYALRVVGSDGEWMWGHGRHLLIYLLAALGGSCAALTKAHAVIGASGAVCGLVAAEGVWLILNRRYLPRRPVQRQLRNLLLSGLLIGLLSMAPGVSGAAHLGGAVVGTAAALLLHCHRFGGTIVRTLAVLGLLALPAGCLLGLKQASARWPAADRGTRTKSLTVRHIRELRKLADRSERFSRKRLQRLLDRHELRRDAQEVRTALTELPDLGAGCRTAAEGLRDLGKQPSKEAEQCRRDGMDNFERWADFLEAAHLSLATRRKWADPAGLQKEAEAARQRWLKALKDFE